MDESNYILKDVCLMSDLIFIFFLACVVLLLVGLINPRFAWPFKRRTRSRVLFFYGAIIVYLLFLIGKSVEPEINNSNNEANVSNLTNTKELKNEEAAIVEETNVKEGKAVIKSTPKIDADERTSYENVANGKEKDVEATIVPLLKKTSLDIGVFFLMKIYHLKSI